MDAGLSVCCPNVAKSGFLAIGPISTCVNLFEKDFDKLCILIMSRDSRVPTMWYIVFAISKGSDQPAHKGSL